MDSVTFTHYKQELIDSARNRDVIKLMVQVDYFKELTLIQQMEIAQLAEEHIPPELFLELYERIVAVNNLAIRKNSVGRKLFKQVFVGNKEILKKVVASVDSSDSRAFDFVCECIAEINDSELLSAWHDRKCLPGSSSREERLSYIIELAKSKTPESVAKLSSFIGDDIGLDIIIVNSLAALNTKESYKVLLNMLGTKSTRLRSYVNTKLECGGNCEEFNDVLFNVLIECIASESIDHIISLFEVLKRTGGSSDFKELRQIRNELPNNINVQVVYLETLARLDHVKAAPVLVEQLIDGVDDIAFCAVTLLDEAVTTGVISGILNVLESSMITVERLVELLIFGNASNLIDVLKSNDNIGKQLKRFCSLKGMWKYAEKYHIEIEPDNVVSAMPKREMRIWAVDDSKMILRMYEHFGHEKQYSVTTFLDVEPLLTELTDDMPDLLLIDLNMPDINGVEFAQKIDEQSTFRIPKILVTTQSDVDDDTDIPQGLFDDIVVKPFTSETLDSSIQRLL